MADILDITERIKSKKNSEKIKISRECPHSDFTWSTITEGAYVDKVGNKYNLVEITCELCQAMLRGVLIVANPLESGKTLNLYISEDHADQMFEYA